MNDQPEPSESVASFVKNWLKRVRTAEDHWEADFQRMRKNMSFVSGLQWPGQVSLSEEDRYIANLTMQMVRHKVAYLYARDPKVEILPRPRMRFRFWDEDIATLADAFQRVMLSRQAGVPDLEAELIMQDQMHGRQEEEMVEKFCRTLKYVFDYQVDCSKPEYKEQMKQLVTRVVTCGVAYCRPYFVRGGDSPISTVETRHSVVDRARVAKVITDKLADGELDETSPEIETLRTLILSMGFSTQTGDEYELQERIEFDFPQPTSIIPDIRCRSLKEFVAARFIAQRFNITLDDVNEVFGTEIEQGSLRDFTGEQGEALPTEKDAEDNERKLMAVYEVMDYVTKTHFFIMRGHNDYLQAPEPLDPCVSGFWPLFALTFNDVESDGSAECATSIFPPSDVDLVRPAQLEWNRTRQALREHRNGNAPKYPVRKGQLTDADKHKLETAQPNAVIEYEGIPSDTAPADWIKPMQMAPIDPLAYDTAPIEHDIQVAGGAQQANLGPAQPDVTATVGTIAEQSRMTVSSSNVDDLDGFLSRVSRASCEMIIRAFSPPTVTHIADVGAIWPQQREDFLNLVQIKIKAASSGRPNQALEVANYERIAPQLMAAGANPVAVIEEGVRRLDDRLDVVKFFPPPQVMGPEQGPGQKKKQPGQKNGAPVGVPANNMPAMAGQ